MRNQLVYQSPFHHRLRADVFRANSTKMKVTLRPYCESFVYPHLRCMRQEYGKWEMLY